MKENYSSVDIENSVRLEEIFRILEFSNYDFIHSSNFRIFELWFYSKFKLSNFRIMILIKVRTFEFSPRCVTGY